MTMGALLEESVASLQNVRRSIFDESLKVVDLIQPGGGGGGGGEVVRERERERVVELIQPI